MKCLKMCPTGHNHSYTLASSNVSNMSQTVPVCFMCWRGHIMHPHEVSVQFKKNDLLIKLAHH